MKNSIYTFFPILVLISISACLYTVFVKNNIPVNNSPTKEAINTLVAEVSTPSPTPAPLTFSEMNKLWGPCVRIPTIMYHHIQDPEEAKKQGHAGLAVSPQFFEKHAIYLRGHGYSTVSMQNLTDFFDNRRSLPSKPVMLTFDDGYDDFYTNAFPIIQRYSLIATMFLPTGLVNNSGYLTWDQVNIMKSQNILFANHTWSHKGANAGNSVLTNEIQTADKQLSDHGLGNPKVFAYPYGSLSGFEEMLLGKLSYTLAFTTKPGTIACKQKRFILPRVRVGNATLDRYGF